MRTRKREREREGGDKVAPRRAVRRGFASVERGLSRRKSDDEREVCARERLKGIRIWNGSKRNGGRDGTIFEKGERETEKTPIPIY